MYIGRYNQDSTVQNGKILGTNRSIANIRSAIANGNVATTSIVMKEGMRLDALAGEYYGDGRLWWVIAAASNIGWWLQAPPGTLIVIPTDMNQILGVI